MTGLQIARILGYEPLAPDDAEETVFFEGYGDERDDDIQDAPTMGALESWAFDSLCGATDGCAVEPDGTCPHGHDSWLIAAGMV